MRSSAEVLRCDDDVTRYVDASNWKHDDVTEHIYISGLFANKLRGKIVATFITALHSYVILY